MAERSVLIVQNITREGPGIISSLLKQNAIMQKTVNLDAGDQFPSPKDFGAVVVMGGPDSANDTTPKMLMELYRIRETIDSKIPYLGICLGMQTLVKAAGGNVTKADVREIGFIAPDVNPFKVKLTEKGKQDPLFKGLGDEFNVFHLHGETVQRPDNVELLAKGDFVENQIVKVGNNAYGIQSHFELTDEMLEDWIAQDDDLKTLDADDLRKYFAKVKDEYTRTAWALFTNFLKIANL